jgi:hypothetical protein
MASWTSLALGLMGFTFSPTVGVSLVLLFLGIFAAGFALSRWFKVLGMIPATIISWSAAVGVGRFEGLSSIALVTLACLAGLCLQIGYISGALIFRMFLGARRKVHYAHAKR